MTPLPLAFVIGGTGESLSLIGPFSLLGGAIVLRSLLQQEACFPHFRDQPLDLSPRDPGGGAVEWGSLAHSQITIKKICFPFGPSSLCIFRDEGGV